MAIKSMNEQELVKQEKKQVLNPTGKGGFKDNPQNINRNGRPKKGMTLTDIAKEILEEEVPNSNGMTRKEALMRKIATLAYDGNETMIKMIWNYVDGMPTQKTELTGDITLTKLLGELTGEDITSEPTTED